ncbi:MAG: rRNA maturation RNase YbeY [Clostridiales bacterium]|uniref:Endoribonuclease YbeY n=1 Tax=Harryflintia acetispora TaxID=1849041 RepID=A0A9X8ULQ6_9FIRM|nr:MULTISPECIES: rRNA maturation RNase YbeY [Oscillospiraceae]PWM39779.1 MAG: rRNA maturation RNase YbeY [Clostridiales bacterium]RGB69950.1 rRNA maturation RNase YbeY [Harryflintia acetispora]TCL44738.1 putative rRNA maturation factor [Harryflintia acetispora]
MSVVKVMISDRQKEVKIPTGIRLLIRRSCHAVLEMEGFHEPCEVSVSFIGNDEIRQLNKEYRDKDAVTDVLSFPNSDNGQYDLNPDTGCYMLGDIVISVARAAEQAEQFGHSLQREISFLTVHSMLHLLGYDHEQGGIEQVRMREKEEAVLAKLGLERNASYVLDEDE